jgi:hypothetical protein
MKKFLNRNIVENQNFIVGLIAGLVIAGLGLVVFQFLNNKNLSPEKAGAKSINYINDKILNGQATATLEKISDAGNYLYKLKLSVGGQNTDSYMTKDGQYLFPYGYDIATSTNSSATPTDVVKNDKPEVELFVMSYCPYGTQIEKGILPVIQALGDKINFNLKFVNYVMHGEKEITENIKQYCIQKEQPTKLDSYLTCFLKTEDSNSCLNSTGVNQAGLNSCIKNTDQQFNISKQFADKSSWKSDYPPFGIDDADNIKYGVQGSPTLVINGAKVESTRDSAGLLNTICNAFNTKPEVCGTLQLPNTTPTPGFGEETDNTNNAAAAAGSCQ